MVLIEKICDR